MNKFIILTSAFAFTQVMAADTLEEFKKAKDCSAAVEIAKNDAEFMKRIKNSGQESMFEKLEKLKNNRTLCIALHKSLIGKLEMNKTHEATARENKEIADKYK